MRATCAPSPATARRETAEQLRADALRLWCKISPLDRGRPELAARYGLAPHQQPADIYSDPGHEGRGGWSWYAGAATRMLWAAYGLLGLKLREGALRGEFAASRSDGCRLLACAWRGKSVPAGDSSECDRERG